MTETLLERAQAGDGEAFKELTDPYRRELQLHCYRIVGSVQDAEDVLQEVLLSAWRSIGSFDGRSLRAWLYRIATNRSLNHVRDQARRPRPAASQDLEKTAGNPSRAEDPFWLEPYPDLLVDQATPGPEARYEARESIALSFVSALQRLASQQRAVLVLRDVLGFSAAEAADMLGTTPASVNSALSRARASFQPGGGVEAVPLPRSSEEKGVVERFVDAFESVDIDRVVALLTEDAKIAMPPEPVEYRGRLNVGAFLQSLYFWGRPLRTVPTRANGPPAFGYYISDPATSLFRINGLMVLELRGQEISTISRFAGGGLLERFDLPGMLES
jgi:RNA polymerase sigma-70 factor (ECF subfamily)